MENKISFEKFKNSTNNQSSSLDHQFINRKRKIKFKVKKERKDDKRREYFWSLFNSLNAYINKEFGINFNLNIQTQFEAIYGCTIEIMKKVLNLKIYKIISLFKKAFLNLKDNRITDAYIKLKAKKSLHETFLFFMECTYDQLLALYFKDNIHPKENINISSFLQMITKNKTQIINTINEIKTKKGRKPRKKERLKLDDSKTLFKDFEQNFLEKEYHWNSIKNNRANSINDITNSSANNGIQGENLMGFEFIKYETFEFENNSLNFNLQLSPLSQDDMTDDCSPNNI